MGRISEAAEVAGLYRRARARRSCSQDAAADGATNYLVQAAEAGLAWAQSAGELLVERHFVARMESLGAVAWSQPATRIKARALAEYYGAVWTDVLLAAGMLVPEDLGGPAPAIARPARR